VPQNYNYKIIIINNMYSDFKLKSIKEGPKTYWYFSYKEYLQGDRGATTRVSNNYSTEKRAILEINKLKNK